MSAISQSEAIAIACGFARFEIEVAEVTEDWPPGAYRSADLKEACWFVIYTLAPVLTLCSSNFVAISKASGQILATGSTGDEG